MSEIAIQNVRFDERGMIPAVVQDASTSEIVALQYLDSDTLARLLQTGQAGFLAESKKQGACRLLDVKVNSDGGSLTVLVERGAQEAGGEKRGLLSDIKDAPMANGAALSLVNVGAMEFGLALNDLFNLIAERKDKRPEGSYTTYLFNSGLDKILKKIAEESGEVIIAAKNKALREIISELADLFYHLLVLMVERDIELSDVHKELARRAGHAGQSQ
jgi:phosphoribosyl-ATP pyrophosphohydrolase/phosphoribosyl-AMP cyclohydrolase